MSHFDLAIIFTLHVKYESCLPIQYQGSWVSLKSVEFLPYVLVGTRNIISTVNSV